MLFEYLFGGTQIYQLLYLWLYVFIMHCDTPSTASQETNATKNMASSEYENILLCTAPLLPKK